MNNGDNILIIRLSAIGDVVFASPLISALKQSFPSARLSWLVEPAAAPLLIHHPELDEVIIWPKSDWRQLWEKNRFFALWREISRFRRELMRRQFDSVLDLQGLLKSGVLAWFSGARERIGLGSREGSQWLMSRVMPRGGDPDRIGSEYLFLGQQLGLATGAFEMQVALGESDRRSVSQLLEREGLSSGYLVVCPFTTRPQKHWFEERWAALVLRLSQEFAVPPVMLGGVGDREASERVSRRLDGKIVNLTGRTTLAEAAALICRAKLLVGVDTGLTHMGVAFATPTVALFGSTCPYLETTRDNALVLYHKLNCSPCRRSPTCNGEFNCMAAIGVEEVVAATKKITRSESGSKAQIQIKCI
ncbi:MAG: glycosyltransferase family 9 protein [Gammaproteobacteria bacterium]|nr:glycosyltransferase family 9 protein [Gammaproteobacteria bacterium]